MHSKKLLPVFAATTASAALAIASANATAPPVGPLPAGPVSSISTSKGQLVAVALPRRANGLVWRIARPVNPTVLQQVSEANVDGAVIVVFRAMGRGTVTVSFGLTRGETVRARDSRRYKVSVT